MDFLPDDPRHGSPAGAVAHWRAGQKACETCLRAHRRASKAAKLDAARGNPRTVNLGNEAIDVIKNTPLAQLSDATGMKVDRLIRYRHAGPEGRVHRSTRDRILRAGRRTYYSPIGIQRRIKALNALGWSMAAIARESGQHIDTLKRLRNREKPKFVCKDVAYAVIDTFDRLSMTVAPTGASATRTRELARKNRWRPPLAWHPDEIDNKSVQASGYGKQKGRSVDDYDEAVVIRLLDLEPMDATPLEKAEAVRRWVASGRSARQFALAHGWNDGRYGKGRDAA